MRKQRQLREWKKTEMEKEENSGKRSLETSPSTDKDIKAGKKKKVKKGKDYLKGSGDLLKEIIEKKSGDAIEAVNILYSTIKGLAVHLAFAKDKLEAYEKVKGAPQKTKPANTYANIAQRIVATKNTKRINIGQRLLLVVIKLKTKDKFKTMEKAKTSLPKAFCPSRNKDRIKKMFKGKTLLWRQILSRLCRSLKI